MESNKIKYYLMNLFKVKGLWLLTKLILRFVAKATERKIAVVQ